MLQHAAAKNKNDRQLEFQLLEVQGLYLARTGSADAGLKLLARVVDRLKNDYNHHSWGNGAYYMESWGVAALQAGKYDVAEEAYLEALAHDPASVRAALGMQVLCERLGRTEEAQRFSDLAQCAGPGRLTAAGDRVGRLAHGASQRGRTVPRQQAGHAALTGLSKNQNRHAGAFSLLFLHATADDRPAQGRHGNPVPALSGPGLGPRSG